MSAAKLPSGSWRYRKQINGIRYQFTSEKKLTKPEIEEVFHELARGSQGLSVTDRVQMNVLEAMRAYNALKEPVLSPSTIKDYDRMPIRFPEWVLKLKLRDIDGLVLQKIVNDLTIDHSQKTVKNMNGYLQSVCRALNPSFPGYKVDIKPTIPKEDYIPTSEEVRTLRALSKGTGYELQLSLACFGLRRSEVCALTKNDLKGNVLTINKALVQDKDKNWIIKKYPKTADSIRQIILPDELCAKIRVSKRIVEHSPNSLNRWLRRTCERVGMPQIRLHSFRHWVATELTQRGLPEADILRYCGWSQKGDVMRKVYRHSRIQSEKEKAEQVAQAISNLII